MPTTTTTTTTSTSSPSPSPSPPPRAPIPLTPGPRANRLHDVYEKSLISALNTISYPAFSSCFPSISRNAPEALRAVHGQMVSRLRDFAIDEFKMILGERRVVERLNGLEGVIEGARRRKARGVDADAVEGGKGGGGVALHTLPAPSILAAHLTLIYTTQQSQLNAKLQTTQSQNAILAEEIRKQREEIERLVQGVEAVVEDLDRANGVLEREVDGLGREALEAEGVLREV
ncbi:hypothetical protein SBOR_4495 [Sclerotinia borealis F-4128]|uniref:MIND kinetochore complex component Nnf1 n=1 Tax=Sclerotinia borealis (strain F-4128) TaxID=1432307 RepID=W9CGP6_SCLBF|nr:hypothetical protein SBOR_4495 [Sclerotinia borealis F-4128]